MIYFDNKHESKTKKKKIIKKNSIQLKKKILIDEEVKNQTNIKHLLEFEFYKFVINHHVE